MQLIILDRDGVINKDSPEFIKAPEEWEPIKGSLEAIAQLSQANYQIVILTNQSGVGRGLFNADTLAKIHVRMMDHIHQHGGKIQAILFCPHHPDDGCTCRKPNIGLYTELGERLGISFKGVYSVGDSIRDLQAAKSAGASPVLVKTGNGKKSLKRVNAEPQLGLADALVFDSLAAFTQALLNQDL